MGHLIISGALAAQSLQLNKGCEKAHEIVLDESGIHPVSKTRTDTLVADMQSAGVLYTAEDSTLSTWYKIFVNTDCRITFDIYPDKEGNTYNYFFYESPKEISICDVKNKSIKPLRANLFKDEMFFTGTGLSAASTITYYDTVSPNMVQDLYHTPYHASVPAREGSIYYLNIYHVKGKDCGYHFSLKSNKYSHKFESLAIPCYRERLQTGKIKRFVNLYPLRYIPPVTKPVVEEAAKATFWVRDSTKHTLIEAEVSRMKKSGVPAGNASPVIKGKYEMELVKNTGYHLVFSAMGYKSMDVLFVTGESLKSFTNEVYLSPCKAGDNFVMDEIYFFPNTYKMKPGSEIELDQLAYYLQTNKEVSIEIQGHTNGNNRIKASYESGFSGSSKKLSQYRAEVIKTYLTTKGVAAERLLASGYGGSRMIHPDPKNQTQANKNIRVEVLILSQKEAALTSAAGK